MTRPAPAGGGVLAVELVEACLQRIEIVEAEVEAWEHLRPRGEIVADARAASSRPPLYGLPLAVKDIIDVAGLPTGCGSPIHAGRVASMDAACVALLRRAGAVILGKTVTTEFAYFRPGKTHNPHDPERTPGGSSSGSAAAVASGMAPVALGTQTAGSVIRPAAYCGVTGYVATRGELPLRGVQPLAPALDTLGLLADSPTRIRAVRAAVLDGATPSHAHSTATPRIAVWSGEGMATLEPAMRTTLDRLAWRLEATGSRVEPLGCPDALVELTELHDEVMAFEAARALAPESDTPELLGAELRALLERGRAQTYSVHRAACERATVASEPVLRLLYEVDAILAPAALGAAPQGLDSTGSPQLSRAWQLLGLPAVTFPAGRDEDGMPLGLQLIGAAHSDDALLELAASFQRVAAAS